MTRKHNSLLTQTESFPLMDVPLESVYFSYWTYFVDLEKAKVCDQFYKQKSKARRTFNILSHKVLCNFHKNYIRQTLYTLSPIAFFFNNYLLNNKRKEAAQQAINLKFNRRFFGDSTFTLLNLCYLAYNFPYLND